MFIETVELAGGVIALEFWGDGESGGISVAAHSWGGVHHIQGS